MEKETVIISDVHLGSKVSRAKELKKTLELETFDRLILAGDIFDDLNFKRFQKSHWKLLSFLRKISKNKEIIWVVGNHDGPAEVLSNILGISIVDEFVFEHYNKKYLVIHGDQFDSLIRKCPTILTFVSDSIGYLYIFLQSFNRKLTRYIKQKSKDWLKVSKKVSQRAINYAIKKGVDSIICGHTHYATKIEKNPIIYYNTGCWTDDPSSYIKFFKNKKEPEIIFIK